MKQIGVCASLIVLLCLSCIGCDFYLSRASSEVIDLIEDDSTDCDLLSEKWTRLLPTATLFCSYDLIRTADSAYATFLAAYADDPNSVDTKTARAQLIAALEALRSVFRIRWERII